MVSCCCARSPLAMPSTCVRPAAAPRPDIATGRIQLNAAASRLHGDVLIESGSADITLGRGSVLTGALIERGGGRVNRLALDASSVWNVRADSSLAVLDNAGTVAFVAPGAKGGFKTLTVNQYIDGGLLVLNTRLGDDASPTDRLVIDGGSATGRACASSTPAEAERRRRKHPGGADAPWRHDAGRLPARCGLDRLSPERRHAGRERLRIQPGTRRSGRRGARLVSDLPRLIRPRRRRRPAAGNDAAACRPAAGARLAASRCALAQCVARAAPTLATNWPAPRSSPMACTIACRHAALAARPGTPSAEGGASYRGIWTRVQGRQDSGLRMAEGRVRIERSSQIVQLGGDLLTARRWAARGSAPGPHGRLRQRAQQHPPPAWRCRAARQHAGAGAQQVSGYSAGVYGTYYQDDASRMGAYADGWLQYGRFNNRIDSELGAARYDSTVWSASAKPAMRSSLSPSARRWGRSLSSRTSSWSTATTMRRMPCCRGPAWAKATPAPGTRMPACACIPRPLRARRRCVRSWNWIGCTASIRRPCGWGPTRWPPRPRATAWN